MKQYLENELNITQVKGIFWIIPINSCSPCVEKNLDLLKKIPAKNRLTIILVGKTDNKKLLNGLGSVKNKILYDTNNNASNYSINLFKPILVNFISDDKAEYMMISDFEIERAADFITSQN